MKIAQIIPCLVLQSLLGSAPFAAAFDCDSTGAYGAMNIANDTTLQLPPDGIFHCTTITVAPGATLRFTNNALNTPVYLLATEDIVVSGVVDVSGYCSSSAAPGRGGPGGFDGGNGGSTYYGLTKGGDGKSPGGGKPMWDWDRAAFGRPCLLNTNTYGNLLLVPLIGGSGGAGTDFGTSYTGYPGAGRSGGGGAVLFASNTRIVVNGTIKAVGGAGCTPYLVGSGGGIRLVAPLVEGNGSLNANGGDTGCCGTAGAGRIRVDCTDNQAYRSLSLTGVASRGSHMVVFSAVIPQLDILEVGGQPIAEGTNKAVVLELAVGASTNQTVRVQARNFTGDVPIRIVITPENGPSGSFDATILQASGSPPSATVPVIIPAGSACQIHAWTR